MQPDERWRRQFEDENLVSDIAARFWFWSFASTLAALSAYYGVRRILSIADHGLEIMGLLSIGYTLMEAWFCVAIYLMLKGISNTRVWLGWTLALLSAINAWSILHLLVIVRQIGSQDDHSPLKLIFAISLLTGLFHFVSAFGWLTFPPLRQFCESRRRTVVLEAEQG